ncbi:Cof-type HAD-IIB family hydrolase [Actinomycetaceae bacterium L2_0104]
MEKTLETNPEETVEETTIRAVATDMDGTFLDSSSDYDRLRFERIFEHMRRRRIRFIVASGNQYAQLKTFFPGKDSDIVYVSDNGTALGEEGVLRATTEFPAELVNAIASFAVDEALSYGSSGSEGVTPGNVTMVLCGLARAYILEGASAEFKELARKYYYETAEISSFERLPDDVFLKLMLEVDPETVDDAVARINERFGDRIVAVWGGAGSIDIALPGVSKGSTIRRLLESWRVSSHELVSFGDADNDLEMLAMTEHGYAMANTRSDRVRAAAKRRAPSNDDSGVLRVLEELLGIGAST